MDLQNISKVSIKDLSVCTISECVYIYLQSGQIPFYCLGKNIDDPIFSKILFNEFNDFIQDTRHKLTLEHFIDNCKWWWDLIPSKDQQIEIKRTLPVFSYYSKPITNTNPRCNIDLFQLYEVIRNPKYFEKQTIQLRSIEDKAQKAEYKKTQFDYVTFSGTFEKRNTASLIKPSGYLCIDLDHVQTDIIELKTKLICDLNLDVQLMFVSPSGDGLKIVITYNTQQNTIIEIFELLESYFLQVYNIQIDKACKNIDRACFIPFDKDIFINPKILKQ